MAEYTKGPWRVERQNPSPTTGEWMIAGSTPGYIAEVRDCGGGRAEANAAAISAVPELIEALIAMIDLVDVICPIDGPTQRAARSAIEKATGEYGRRLRVGGAA